MCLLNHRISQPSLDISAIWISVIEEEKKKTPSNVDLVGKFVFLCYYHKEYFYSPVISIWIVICCKASYI
jgi:hypothetical protein